MSREREHPTPAAHHPVARGAERGATVDERYAKWSGRLEEWRALGVQVNGEKLAAEVLSDLRLLVVADTVSLREAHAIGGYSLDHLARLIRQQKLTNEGRRHAPRLRRADVPIKPGHAAPALLAQTPANQLSVRRRIVADAQAYRGA